MKPRFSIEYQLNAVLEYIAYSGIYTHIQTY